MNVLLPHQDAWLFTTLHLNPGKETVLLLHGGPGVPEGLTFVRKYLARQFQVLSFHQRGTLMSPCRSQDYSLDRYLSDITCLAGHFRLERFHLLGHSWGGLYAQLYAQRNPNRLLSLFLANPASGTGTHWKEMSLEIARYNQRKSTWWEWLAMNAHAGLGLLGRDQGYRGFFRQALLNFSRGFKEVYPEQFALHCIKAQPINRTVKAILSHPELSPGQDPSCPVTVVYGQQDIYGESMRHVVQRYPKARFAFLPTCGHIPWSHNQPAFLEVLNGHFRIS
ncbi:alpha/beta fold hydrolase [Rufibacter glacialis]|uniref:Alpha/beta fold hydrolase n=1 Tax=Rufibacter glacialis TaxID=1259555 RepID=A0A5M8QC73_9BACT|nr:alpha/beta hydrolase [Rufibacter glacialis]KAA6432416.1 alpha/beta hydrolase [Rufibacter glacialis]GGK78488.1 alpha/beta hydrolase [Rufibacter glacialis]